MIEPEDLAAWTVSAETQQDFILCVGVLPAGAFRVEIGRAFWVYIFRTIQHAPAGILPFPEVYQPLSP